VARGMAQVDRRAVLCVSGFRDEAEVVGLGGRLVVGAGRWHRSLPPIGARESARRRWTYAEGPRVQVSVQGCVPRPAARLGGSGCRRRGIPREAPLSRMPARRAPIAGRGPSGLLLDLERNQWPPLVRTSPTLATSVNRNKRRSSNSAGEGFRVTNTPATVQPLV
jgi:hypothetical protein